MTQASPLSSNSTPVVAPAAPAITHAYRFGFVMQQVLGHITAYQHFRRYVEQDATVVPTWTEVTYHQPGGSIERLPLVPAGVKGVARAALQVRGGLRAGRYDAALFNSQALCLFVRGYMRRVPSLIVTDVTPRQFDEMGPYYGHPRSRESALSRYKHRVNVDVYRSARLIAPWSNWTKDSLVRDYGVPEEKVVVVPPGVNVVEWAPPPAGTREASLRASGGLPRVLFVGGDFERKGGSLLLDWFRTRGQGHCELDIVTRMPPTLPASLPGLRLHTGLEAGDPRLTRLYHECHLFALPTLADCFGVASIEAMATGLPVVTTAVGGVPDIVADGEQGYLIQPDDRAALASALERLVADAALRLAMGEHGRRTVLARFDSRQNALRLLDLMKEIAAGSTARGGESTL